MSSIIALNRTRSQVVRYCGRLRPRLGCLRSLRLSRLFRDSENKKECRVAFLFVFVDPSIQFWNQIVKEVGVIPSKLTI